MQAGDLVDVRGARRQQDHRQVAALAQGTEDLQTVGAGHHDVQDNEVEASVAQVVRDLIAVVGDNYLEPLLRQVHAHKFGDAVVVVRDQDARGCHRLGSSAGPYLDRPAGASIIWSRPLANAAFS